MASDCGLRLQPSLRSDDSRNRCCEQKGGVCRSWAVRVPFENSIHLLVVSSHTSSELLEETDESLLPPAIRRPSGDSASERTFAAPIVPGELSSFHPGYTAWGGFDNR